MVEATRTVLADEEKLRAVLAERGLPVKLEARLSPNERKVHELLCASYNFATGMVALEMPRYIVKHLGPQFQKIWDLRPTGRGDREKAEVVFSMTTDAIRIVLRTALIKDVGIFKAKVNIVRLHSSWTQHMKAKAKKADAPVDWSKHEDAAKRHNAAVTEQILDGKTFNAQKDNAWARKNLKNWKNQQN